MKSAVAVGATVIREAQDLSGHQWYVVADAKLK